MKRFQLLMATMGIVISLLLTGCGSQGVPGAINKDLEDFTFTDQNNEAFSKSDLKGKVWVADFIFTNCETVCSPMTSNLVDLNKMLEDEGIEDVEFVSFSIDPELDTPEVLTEFAQKFEIDFTNWSFLTGYSQETIEEFAKVNFEALVLKPDNEDQVIHGTKFYLVDQEGKVIMDYSGVSDVPYEEIIKHIKILQNY